MYLLEGSVKNYAWGKRGQHSLVSQFSEDTKLDSLVHENTPYAELWFGTHPNGMAVLRSNGITLEQKLGRNLPFLFKVLSVGNCLSIQCHPNRKNAEMLHRENPTVYKDGNHKPEICYALTPFKMMLGFRSPEELSKSVEEFPELLEVVLENAKGSTLNQNNENFTKMFFENYTKAKNFKQPLKKLIKRLKNFEKKSHKGLSTARDSMVCMILTLAKQFPLDLGVFAPLVLNTVTLEPGEAIFIPPGVPHAYISGDCIECMACSDNVLRCGLTPKLRDTANLLRCIDFEKAEFQNLNLEKVKNGRVIDKEIKRTSNGGFVAPVKIDKNTIGFGPGKDFWEFYLEITELKTNESHSFSDKISSTESSIIFILSGRGYFTNFTENQRKFRETLEVKKGDCLLVKRTEQLMLTCTQTVKLARCRTNESDSKRLGSTPNQGIIIIELI